MRPGMRSTTLVPLSLRLQTRNWAPILSDRSRIPGRPQCPSRQVCITRGSIPRPSSSITSRNCRWEYSISTSMVFAPEWRNALRSASRPMRPRLSLDGDAKTERNCAAGADSPDCRQIQTEERACPADFESRQSDHVGRDQPKVFRDERQVAQFPLGRQKKLGPWTGHPLPVPRAGLPHRHVPGRRETAKMIQPNHVDMRQQGPQTVDAPAITGTAKNIPVVNGIAPCLPIRAEVIGRHTGDESRPALGPQAVPPGGERYIRRAALVADQ